MVTAQDILSLAEAYATAHGLELVTVSSRVFNDGKKLSSIKDGSDLTLKRALHALRWFSDQWPDHLDWPETIDRPSKSEVAA